MTPEQITERMLALTEELAAVKESTKSAHKRIDENDRITEGIHEIASSVQALAVQVKLLADKMDENVDSLKGSIKSQGERIGKLEQEPADRWKSLVSQVIGLVVAAVAGVVLAKFI